VIYRDVSGEFVLLNLQSGVYYGLDAIGSRMWQLLTEQRDVDEVCSILIDEYETSSDVLRADVDRLVSELAEKAWCRFTDRRSRSDAHVSAAHPNVDDRRLRDRDRKPRNRRDRRGGASILLDRDHPRA
jgi:hypothetical protein